MSVYLQKCDKEEYPTVWRELAELTLCQVMVFNKKRQGEMSKMTVDDFSKCTQGRQDMITQGLSKWEQELASIMWRVEVVGKRGNTVPVLLTSVMKGNMDLLQDSRKTAEIWDDNHCMFPLHSSTGHIRGADVLRKFTKACGAKHPHNITGTSLRKHVAVVSQIMNLKNNDLDVLARFMGHDIRTHREYYRLPDELIQLAKVSKVLLKFGNGDLQSLAGKTLDEIELHDDEGNIFNKMQPLNI